jgi:type IV pilus assembly protein PilX
LESTVMKHSTAFIGSHLARERGVSVLFAMLALVALSAAAAGLVRTTSSNSLAVGNLALKADTAAFADRGTEAAIQFLNASIAANPASLDNDSAGDGYYAQSFASGLDPTQQRNFAAPLPDPTLVPDPTLSPMGPGPMAPPPPVNPTAARVAVDWGDGCQGTFGSCVVASPVVNGPNNNSYQYVITRLCVRDGGINALDPVNGTNTCATPLQQVAAGNTTRDGFNYQTSQRVNRLTVNQASYRIVVRARGARNAVTYTETIVRI